MEKVLHLEYESTLSGFREINTSFDIAKMRVAYTGKNRNGSYISKDTFLRCMKTIFNCPVVCNYSRIDDSIGGHDVELAVNDDGDIRLVNLTVPVGVVPESASPYFETVEEKDGTEHEYLCTDILLWKRQEAYDKLHRDGAAGESMEITVKSGHKDKELGAYVIDSFEFTAFCLLGNDVKPCFESASVELYSHNMFKMQMEQMMAELRETFTLVNPSDGKIEDNYDYLVKGGSDLGEKKDAFTVHDEITADESALNDRAVDEAEAAGNDMPEAQSTEAPVENEQPSAEAAAVEQEESFTLEGPFRDELRHAVEMEIIEDDWCGAHPRYWFHDYDRDVMEVYAFDSLDEWNLYGFAFAMDGDVPVIDFASKKRMKIAVVPFDEGAQANPFASAFTKAKAQYDADHSAWEEKYQEASGKLDILSKELGALRQFRDETEKAKRADALVQLFAEFEDLAGVEEFEALREDSETTPETLREKCYAIRGKRVPVKFSLEHNSTKIIVDKTTGTDEPYGGVFIQYGNR